jgi:hypothetical protein
MFAKLDLPANIPATVNKDAFFKKSLLFSM